MTVRVGITCNRVGYENRLSKAYVKAVLQAGAMPLLLPVCGDENLWKEMATSVDALLLSGGGDPDAALFGEEALPEQGSVQPDRDEMELYLARYALNNKIPILGICRGAQMMAIAGEGKLLQDLAGIQKVQHDQKAPRNYPIHSVLISSNSMLHRICREKSFRVNSLHHQAIRYPGPKLKISAVARDGVIEAVEMPGHPFALGVQWHPEWLCTKYHHASVLFTQLKEAAAGQKHKK